MPAPSKPKKERPVEVPQGEMEILQVSRSPLRGASHVDFRADLVQHHARVERLLSQMLGKIKETTSATIRTEFARLPLQAESSWRGGASEINTDAHNQDLTVEEGWNSGDFNAPKSLPGVVNRENRLEEPGLVDGNGKSTDQTRTASFVSWAEEAPAEGKSKRSPNQGKSRLTMRVPWKLEKTKVTGVKEILAKFTLKQSQGESSTESWPAWRRAAKRIVASPGFEWFCSSLILLCALQIGGESHWNVQNIGVTPPAIFRVLNTGFNLLFTVELILRLMVDGVQFLSWYNPSIHWNVMDFALVTVALVEEVILLVAASTESIDLSGLKVLRMLRLARILRIVKVVRFFSELRIMVNGVIGSARSLCWALLLILLVNFLLLCQQSSVGKLRDDGR